MVLFRRGALGKTLIVPAHLRHRPTLRLAVTIRQSFSGRFREKEPARYGPHVGHGNAVEVEIEMRHLVTMWVRSQAVCVPGWIGVNLSVVEVRSFLHDGRKVQNSDSPGR